MHTIKQQYQRDGFLVIENGITTDMCDQLKQRAETLIDAFDPTSVQTIFSAKNQQHAKDDYFLDSGDKIRFFFEAEAFHKTGKLITEKRLCINKIGHALHQLDPVFQTASCLPQHTELLNQLGMQHPQIIQSMYICKQPRIGGEVDLHQDMTYLYSTKKSVTGLWIALEDATLENGCLWALPGGHQQPLKSRFRLNAENNKMQTETYDENTWDLTSLIPLEVPKGTAIVLHGLLPHMSKENTSIKSRHAYAIHVMEGDDLFAKDNWMRTPAYQAMLPT